MGARATNSAFDTYPVRNPFITNCVMPNAINSFGVFVHYQMDQLFFRFSDLPILSDFNVELVEMTGFHLRSRRIPKDRRKSQESKSAKTSLFFSWFERVKKTKLRNLCTKCRHRSCRLVSIVLCFGIIFMSFRDCLFARPFSNSTREKKVAILWRLFFCNAPWQWLMLCAQCCSKSNVIRITSSPNVWNTWMKRRRKSTFHPSSSSQRVAIFHFACNRVYENDKTISQRVQPQGTSIRTNKTCSFSARFCSFAIRSRGFEAGGRTTT